MHCPVESEEAENQIPPELLWNGEVYALMIQDLPLIAKHISHNSMHSVGPQLLCTC